MDESGHSGDTGAAEGGDGADARERTRLNGWASPDSPWSQAGAALESETEVPAWRRPPSELRPFSRNQDFPPPERPFGPVTLPGQPSSAQPASGLPAPAPLPAPTPPGFIDAQQSGEIHPPGGPAQPEAPSRWANLRPRYSDLLGHLSPDTTEPARPPAPRTDRAEGGNLPAPLRGFDVPTPNSAPPYPYEGDLDDPDRAPAPPPPVIPPRTTAVPLVRPAAPGSRRVDWIGADPGQEAARHALISGTPVSGSPRVEPAPPGEKPFGGEAKPGPPTYDPSSFPRRLGYEPAPAAEPSGFIPTPAYSGFGSRAADPGDSLARTGDPGGRRIGLGDPGGRRAVDLGDQGTRVLLPQRVPAQPDVPTVPEPPLVEPTAETPALARIATHLRRGDVLPAEERQEGFDVQAILAAVREVAGVRDASLRSTPTGAHSLRLDLAEGADPAEVSRRVARLLQDTMGLDAAMQGEGQAPPLPAALPAAPVSPPRAVGERSREIPRAAASVSAPPATERPSQAERLAEAERVAQAEHAAQDELTAQAERAVQAERVAQAERDARTERAERAERAARAERTVQAERLGRPERTGQHGRPAEERLEERPAQAVVLPSGELDSGPARPLFPAHDPGPRIVIENVHVNTFGSDASVDVRLAFGGRTASGVATGPAVDGYLLRLCAMAATGAVDQLLSTSDHPDGPPRCFVEHAAAVQFGATQVAVVVLLLSCGGWVEQLAGSAVVTGDDRHAMVRATLAAVNRRLEALLSR